MKLISEITITGIVKEYVEGFRGRAERVNKNLLHSILYKVENLCFVRIEELEKENEELKEKCERKTQALVKLIEQTEKMKCCQNCRKERNKPEPLAVHVSCVKCKDYSEWELFVNEEEE